MAKKVAVKAKDSFLSRYKFWLLGVFAALLYFNTVSNSYNLDDELVTTTDPAYPHRLTSKGFEGLTAIFTEPYYKDDQGYAYDYRPITLFTFWLENNLLSTSPAVSHTINALLYGLLCALLGVVLAGLLANYNSLLWIVIVALFIAHPIHTEVVASIKNRDEILSVIFSLGALYYLSKVRAKQHYVPFLFSIGLMVLALLTKTTIIFFALLTPLVLILFAAVPPIYLILFSVLVPLAYMPISAFGTFSDALKFVLVFPFITGLALLVYNYQLLIPRLKGAWHKSLSGTTQLSRSVFSITDKRKDIKPLYEILLLTIVSITSFSLFIFLHGYGKNYYLLPLIALFLPRVLFRLKYELANTLIILTALIGITFAYDIKDVFVTLSMVCSIVIMLSNKQVIYQIIPLLLTGVIAVAFGIDMILDIGLIIVVLVYIEQFTQNRWVAYAIVFSSGFIVVAGMLHFLVAVVGIDKNGFSYPYALSVLPIFFVYTKKFNQIAYPAFAGVLFLSLISLTPISHNQTLKINTGVVMNQPVPHVIPANEIDRPIIIVESVTNSNSPMEFKLGTAAEIIRKYLSLLVIPYPMSFYYGYKIIDKQSVYAPINIITFILYLGVGLMGILLMHKRKIIAFGILVLTVSLATFSNIVVPIPGMVAERFLLVPSLGFCVLLAYLLIKVFKINEHDTVKTYNWSTIPVGLKSTMVVIILLYAGLTISRNFKWKNHITLFAADIDHLQESAQANNLYALQLMKYSFKETDFAKQRQMQEKAEQHFAAALKVYPEFSNAQYDLARTQSILGKQREAETSFYKAAKLNPEFPSTWMSAAEIAMNEKRWAVAKNYLAEGLRFNSNNPDFYINFSLTYYMMGNYDSATVINRLALKLFPNNPNFPANMGQTFAAAGQKDSAMFYYNKALAINPNNDFVLRAIQNLK